jgi:hypothetical protein
LFAIDCFNATGELSSFAPTAAPHLQAVHQPASGGRVLPTRLALPAFVPTVAALAALLAVGGVVVDHRRGARLWAPATDPPGRAPPRAYVAAAPA